MSSTRTFQITLKNDQVIQLDFTSIDQTNGQLWQMFATTEALDVVQQLISVADPTVTSSAKKTVPDPSAPMATPKKKK
jgi:hypothetical protein